MHPDIPQFMQLFSGFEHMFGRYQLTGEVDERGKKSGYAETVKEPIKVEDWYNHITGKMGVGIIPIKSDNTCRFGAIDIDVYEGLDLVSLNNNIIRNNLPVVLCRTKSGGAHIFLFCSEDVPAKLMRRKLREIASLLGYGNAEIFPKQIELLIDRGDIGSWINMPYFDANNTKRYALDDNGRAMDIRQFVKYAALKQVTLEQLKDFTIEVQEHLEGGPPCLQHLISKGFPEGTRNNGLFALGVYARKLSPDNWEELIDKYNQEYMQPPLTSHEVDGVKKSLKKKEYNYPCSQQPIIRYCNQVKCRSCKYGVATGSDMPLLSALTLLKTDPPIFFVDVEEGGRLAVSTEELQNPISFQRICMTQLLIMPPVPKREMWRDMLQPLFENAQVIDVPPDMTPEGELMSHLEEFCTSRVQSETAEGLLQGKVWTSDDRHYFRLKDFMAHLERVKFVSMKRNRICMTFRDQGLEHHQFNIMGKCVQCWSVKEFDKLDGPFSIPKPKDKNIPF